MMLIKNNIEDKANLSSCLATKGQRTQFTTMGTTVPTRKDIPVYTATRAVALSPSYLMLRDMTVKDRQPMRPDRWGYVSAEDRHDRQECKYRMRALDVPVEHRDHEDGSKNSQDKWISVASCVGSASPYCS